MAKSPPTGRTTAPPRPGLPHELGGGDGVYSIYEPLNLRPDPTNGDVQIEIVDANLQPIETLAPAAEIAPRRRAVPVHIVAHPALPTIVPNDGPKPVDTTGPWTVGEPMPMPTSPVIRVMANAPSAPKPKRRAIVKFTKRGDEPAFGPASKAEQEWVIGGETGLRLVTVDEATGRPRLAAVYLAFVVKSYIVDDARPDEVTIFGDIRWHGMPPDRNEEWTNKFLRWHGGERLKELTAALEKFFAFADPRIGMVARFLGGPATTGKAAAAHGYQCFPGNGNPSVKFMVDMSGTQQGARKALDFYQQAQDLFAISLRRWWWARFSPDRAALYTLGERFEMEGLPPAQVSDGLDSFGRACLATEVATLAAGPVASFGKVAWRGDHLIEKALLERQLEPVAHTTYTVYQEGE